VIVKAQHASACGNRFPVLLPSARRGNHVLAHVVGRQHTAWFGRHTIAPCHDKATGLAAPAPLGTPLAQQRGRRHKGVRQRGHGAAQIGQGLNIVIARLWPARRGNKLHPKRWHELRAQVEEPLGRDCQHGEWLNLGRDRLAEPILQLERAHVEVLAGAAGNREIHCLAWRGDRDGAQE
jgi:hypothetical protein